jgi:GT2 family glycosyltransferase
VVRTRIDVVILAWNDGDRLDEAVVSALMSESIDVEVVVVDNGSDLPVSMVDPRVRVLRNDVNRGVAPARNQGVRATDAALVCLLDSDAWLAPGCLRELASAMDDPSVALTVPVFAGQDASVSAGRAPTLGRKILRLCNLRSDYATDSRDPRSPSWDVDFGIGACQLIRRSAFDVVDGLEERYFYGPEDVDFCLRLREVGGRVRQVQDAICAHPARRRSRGLLTRRGLAHAGAVVHHLWRHRGSARVRDRVMRNGAVRLSRPSVGRSATP